MDIDAPFCGTVVPGFRGPRPGTNNGIIAVLIGLKQPSALLPAVMPGQAG